MTEEQPEKPRSLLGFYIGMGVVLALLALAGYVGANWKAFHLAYSRRLFASGDPQRHTRGLELICRHHLRKGMPFKEVQQLLHPMRIECSTNEGTWANFKGRPLRGAAYELYLNVEAHETLKEWKLKSWHFYRSRTGPGKRK